LNGDKVTRIIEWEQSNPDFDQRAHTPSGTFVWLIYTRAFCMDDLPLILLPVEIQATLCATSHYSRVG
jgi:hypothetical protein